MGCILYEIAFGMKAFCGDVDVFSYATSRQGPKIPSQLEALPGRSVQIDDDVRKVLEVLISAMLELEQNKRPTAQFLFEAFSVAHFEELGQDKTPDSLKLKLAGSEHCLSSSRMLLGKYI